MKSIRVKTDGWIQGRNGLFDITAVELSGSYDDGVMIDGIGKRDTVINGGLRVSAEAMDRLALDWLNAKARDHEGKCPRCKRKLSYDSGPDGYDNNRFYFVSCPACGFSGRELYYEQFVGFADEQGDELEV